MKKQIGTIALVFALAVAFGQTNAIRIEKSGKGIPVLLLPGFASPANVWNETSKNLMGQFERHIVAYPGFNGVAPIAMPWYETIKKELVDYVRSQKLSNIHIIGHSMGGNLAVDLAAEMPGLVASIVVVDALPCMRELWMPGVPASTLKYDTPYNNEMLALNDEAFKKNAEMMTLGLTTKTEKVEALIDCFIKADRKTYVYGYTDLLKLDLRETLKKVKAKTLILGAPFPDKDSVLANFEKQYANLTNKTIEIATDSRHYIMFDQPEWFYAQVNAFISK